MISCKTYDGHSITTKIRKHVHYRDHGEIISNPKNNSDMTTYCTPLQFVQTNVKKVVQTYCGPCINTAQVRTMLILVSSCIYPIAHWPLKNAILKDNSISNAFTDSKYNLQNEEHNDYKSHTLCEPKYSRTHQRDKKIAKERDIPNYCSWCIFYSQEASKDCELFFQFSPLPLSDYPFLRKTRNLKRKEQQREVHKFCWNQPSHQSLTSTETIYYLNLPPNFLTNQIEDHRMKSHLSIQPQ